MDFAAKQLEKHGWKTGKGLGRHQQGISKAIQVHRKHDNKGLGASAETEFAWWDAVFNMAAANVQAKLEQKEDIPSAPVVPTPTLLPHQLKARAELYSCFVPASSHYSPVAAITNETSSLIGKQMDPSKLKHWVKPMDDQTLFETCGKRQIRKGARGQHAVSSDDEDQSKLKTAEKKMKRDLKRKLRKAAKRLKKEAKKLKKQERKQAKKERSKNAE